MPSHVVPQLRQTIKNSTLVSAAASQGLAGREGVLRAINMIELLLSSQLTFICKRSIPD
jgi:hypothetical protein